MNNAINLVEKNLEEAAAAQDKLNNKAQAGSSIFGGLAGKIGGLLAT